MENLWPEKSWSGSELESQFPQCQTLSQVTDAVSAVAKDQGAVVCQIIVNGIILTEDQEARYKDLPLFQIQNFAVKVQNVAILLDESLVGCGQYLKKLAESMDKASELFRVEDLKAAQKYYQACLDGVGLFIDMAKHFKIVFENERGPIPFDWVKYESTMATVMGQILDAYRDKNYILVADILEYELVETLNRWQEELAKLERNKPNHGGVISEVQT